MLLSLIIAATGGGARAAEPIDASAFWTLYFNNQYLRLERRPDFWIGQKRSDSEPHGLPGALLKPVRAVPVRIELQVLRQYDYARDRRFGLAALLDLTPAQALDAIIAQDYPYREPAPFGRARMSELMQAVRARLPASGAAADIRAFEQMLAARIADDEAARDQSIAALVWFLGERRFASSSGVLLDVLRRSQYLRAQQAALHFTAIDAAFAAFAKIGDKSRLGELLELMRSADSTGRWKFGLLFERLLSQDELLSATKLGDAYASADAWRRHIDRIAPADARGWALFDARSLFWEIRFLAATRLDRQDEAALRRLAADEVAPVAERARLRLGR